MGRERTDAALARLEKALARADEAARKAQAAMAVGPNPALVRRHDALRRTVADTMSDLDNLIGSIGK